MEDWRGICVKRKLLDTDVYKTIKNTKTTNKPEYFGLFCFKDICKARTIVDDRKRYIKSTKREKIVLIFRCFLI